MSNGVIPALFELVEYICKPDEKVLFLTPSYAYFKYAADHSSRDYACSDLINENGYYTIDWDDLERRCADPKTTLFIHCNPHNPSGRVCGPRNWNASRISSNGTICGSSRTRYTATCSGAARRTRRSAKSCPTMGG